MIDFRSIRHLVLSGGGFKGFAYAGAFAALKKQGIDWGAGIPKLESICGCSVGALFAASIALGFTVSEMDDILFRTDLRRLLTIHFSPGSVSLDSGRGLREVLEELIIRKTKVNVTLGELKGPLLYIAVADLEDHKLLLLSKESTPNVLLVDALMASMALPPIYPPVDIHGHLCADGGLLNFFPLYEHVQAIQLKSCDFHTLLGFRLKTKIEKDEDFKKEIDTAAFPIATYLKRVYDVATQPYLEKCWTSLPEDLRHQCMTLEVPDVHLLEFGLGGGGDPKEIIYLAGKSCFDSKLK